MEPFIEAALQRELLAIKLPTLPAVAIQLIGLGQSEHANAQQLATVVGQDPALATNLLRLSNSAAYRRARQADTVFLAVSYLGFEPARMFALSAALVPALAAGGGPGFCYTAYWRRALLSAACARVVGRHLLAADAEAVALAALLQDIGMLALAQLQGPFYATLECDGYVHGNALSYERERLSTDHAAVGGWLLDRWGLPERLALAVRASNAPDLCMVDSAGVDFNRLVMAAGLLADIWTWSGPPSDLAAHQADVCRLLGCDWPALVEMLDEASDEIPMVEAMCGMQVVDAAHLQLALQVLSERLPSTADGAD